MPEAKRTHPVAFSIFIGLGKLREGLKSKMLRNKQGNFLLPFRHVEKQLKLNRRRIYVLKILSKDI